MIGLAPELINILHNSVGYRASNDWQLSPNTIARTSNVRQFRDLAESSANLTLPDLWKGCPSIGQNDININPAYLGDYRVSSDATGANAGFFSAFQIQTNTNPDVFGMRVQF